MRRPPPRAVRSLAVAGLAAACLVAWRLLAGASSTIVEEAPRWLPVAPAALTVREEAIRLYAAGQFPPACERFGRAAAADPTSGAGRQDVARCFEGWGWQALRGGRANEAALLFQRGLAQAPGDPALL
ncbi:MAG: hypothetical protein HY614_11260, partial [Candidatus Rokubacteria bacterium]|nr:hypothetical protein [Candidatus Rokubacteria bacterium]